MSVWGLLPPHSPAKLPSIQADPGSLWGVWGLRPLPECDNTCALKEGEEVGGRGAGSGPWAWLRFTGLLVCKRGR